jgi:ubiquitin-protein ligase
MLLPLPLEILRKRVKNEIRQCREQTPHDVEIVGDPGKFPLMIKITMHNIPGPDLVHGVVRDRTEHIFVMEISEDYPYQKPLVIWATPIFHPNIMIPDDGGFVCTKLLDEWSFGSNLTVFVKGVEALVSNPNPGNPYGTDSCTRAAEYFNKIRHGLGEDRKPAPRKLPRVIDKD